MPLSSSEFATVERPSTNSRIFAHTRWDGIINGWKVGSIFGDRAFYNGNWLKRAAAAKGASTRYIQKDSPGAHKESNWLSAPNDLIYLVMRLYWPKTEPPSILPPGEGTWKPPGIVKAN